MAENEIMTLDEYVRLPQKYICSRGLVDDIHYKLCVAKDLAKARRAVLSVADDWPDVVKQPWEKMEKKGIIDGMNIAALKSWIDSDQSDALDALQALWAKADTPINDRIILDRIRGFVPRVHPADPKLKKGFASAGVKLKVTTAFLIVLDPYEYPSYKPTEFKNAYKRTGYPVPPNRADEVAVYIHALGFLDKLVGRAKALRFKKPSNRLEAQSIVWSYRFWEKFDPKQSDVAG